MSLGIPTWWPAASYWMGMEQNRGTVWDQETSQRMQNHCVNTGGTTMGPLGHGGVGKEEETEKDVHHVKQPFLFNYFHDY